MDLIQLPLADDREDFLDITSRFLKRESYVIQTIRDASKLPHEVVRLQPEFVALDIARPVLSGIEVVQQLKETDCKAKIVFLTLHQDPDYVRGAFAAGGVAGQRHRCGGCPWWRSSTRVWTKRAQSRGRASLRSLVR